MRQSLKMILPLSMVISMSALPLSSFAADLTTSPIQRVLLISVDGLHASDLSAYIKSNPGSALSEQSRHGITYTHASSTKPSDSFPGLLALVTGGTPNSTGVFYDDSYDRSLLPPVKDGDKPGMEVVYDESIDKDSDKIDGGGGINPDALPRDPVTKKPVYPHDFVKVNTIFEVIKASGKHTAWSDKHLAYDLVNGPSGQGVDDLYTPEIAANGDATTSIAATEANDDLKVAAIVNEIDGKDHSGAKSSPVPAIFGMNFQAVNVGQKLLGNGYMDGNGTMSKGLTEALNHTDQSLGKIVNELKQQNLYDSTMIVITSKHGQSPIDPAKSKIVDKKTIIDGVPESLIAKMTTDDVGLIWLTDASKTDSVVATIIKNKEKANIKDVYSYTTTNPQWPFNNPAMDSRVPDIVIQPNYGVIYTKPGKKLTEHGGFSADDTNVALLVSNAGMKKPLQIDAAVTTTQVAPTILKELGLDPNHLTAVQKEHTQVLPVTAALSNPLQELLKNIETNPSMEEYYQNAAELYEMNKESGYKIFNHGIQLDSSKYNGITSIEGRTLLSAKQLSDILEVKLQWKNSRTLLLTSTDRTVQLVIDSKQAIANNVQQSLDVPASLINGEAFVPLRFVAEAFGNKVGWASSGEAKIISVR